MLVKTMIRLLFVALWLFTLPADALVKRGAGSNSTGPITITGISLPQSYFVSNYSNYQLGTPTVTAIGGSFIGVISLATHSGCASTNNASFSVSGNVLSISGAQQNGSYTICLNATQGASSYYQSFTITGNEVPGLSAAVSASPPYSTACAGGSVFMSPTGNDSNSGTSGSPVFSLNKAQTLLPSPAPGWCIQVATGTYSFTGTQYITAGGNASSTTGYLAIRCASGPTAPTVPGGCKFTTSTSLGDLVATYETAQPTQSGSVTGGNTITVSSATGITNGQRIVDYTTNSAIPYGTTVTISGTTVTTSQNITSSNGDSLGILNAYVVVDGIEFDGNSNTVGTNCLGNYPQAAGGIDHFMVINVSAHNCGAAGVTLSGSDYQWAMNDLIYSNSNTNVNQGSGLNIVQPRALTGYTPTTFDTIYSPYHYVLTWNILHDNTLTFGGSISDGNNLILDTCTNFSYTQPMLVGFTLSYNGGARGFHAFGCSTATFVSNTAYNNNRDATLHGFALGELSQQGGSNNTWQNNVGLATTNAGGGYSSGGNNSFGAVGGNGAGSDINITWLTNDVYSIAAQGAYQMFDNDAGATFSGTIAGPVLTASSVSSSNLSVGAIIYGTGSPTPPIVGTKIVSLGTGSGSNGTYNINDSQTVSSATPMQGGYWACTMNQCAVNPSLINPGSGNFAPNTGSPLIGAGTSFTVSWDAQATAQSTTQGACPALAQCP
jgi:hypothetical protein